MAKLSILAGSTSQTINIFVQDSSSTTGAGLTGLVFNTASLTAYYALPKAAAVSITLATLAAVTTAYSSGGFKEIDATNMPGWYRLDLPDAAIASGRFVSVMLKGATNMAPLPIEIELTAVNNQDGVRGGMTALPNAAASAVGGLPLSVDTSGRVDVLKINGTSQTARDIGASVLLSAGTGTGQLDFTSGVVKANLAQILGTALTETAGQIAAGFKQFFNIASPTSTMNVITTVTTATTATNLTNAPTAGDLTATMKASVTTAATAATPTAAAVTGAVGSVTGAVGSVTGNVGGNVTGTVGSVVGAVGSVTGNVGGNVVGSVGSVTGAVGSVTARVTANTDQLAGQTVTAAAGVTFPTSVASPTNITAGTITTATNVTTVNGLAANVITAASAATDFGAEIAAAVWDLTLAGHTTAGTTGAALNSAGAAADPWATALPGAYGAGTAGKIIGDNINATISSRSTYAGGAVASVTAGVTVTTNNDKTGYALTSAYDLAKTASQAGDSMALTAAERNSTADALLARNVAGGSSAGRLVKEALYVLRNKTSIAAGTMTVCGVDDTTTAFTAVVTTGAGDPITSIDPA